MDNVPVRISDCRCPGTPHEEGDFGYLRPFLDYAGGAEALRMMAAAEGDVTRFGELVGPVYIRRGMVAWNRVDEDGKPLPLPDDPAAELRYEDAYWLAEKADDLYGESVLAPLALKIKKSSPSGQTDGLTSPKRRSPSKRPVRSASS
jgi:hypothetical protein